MSESTARAFNVESSDIGLGAKFSPGDAAAFSQLLSATIAGLAQEMTEGVDPAELAATQAALNDLKETLFANISKPMEALLVNYALDISYHLMNSLKLMSVVQRIAADVASPDDNVEGLAAELFFRLMNEYSEHIRSDITGATGIMLKFDDADAEDAAEEPDAGED